MSIETSPKITGSTSHLKKNYRIYLPELSKNSKMLMKSSCWMFFFSSGITNITFRIAFGWRRRWWPVKKWIN